MTALLGGGLPTDAGQLTDLGSLLTTTRGLLGTAGLDTGVLNGLLATASGLLAGTPLAPLSELVNSINVLLNPVTGGGGGTTGDGGTTGGGGTTTPTGDGGGTTTTTPGAGTKPAVGTPVRLPVASIPIANASFTAYRATLGTLKVSKKRTSVKFSVACPASAPKGCLVKLSGKVAGQRAMPAMTVALPRGSTTPVTVKLNRSTAKRLKKKGGSVQFTAHTALSSLSSVSKSVKVKRPRTKR